MLDTARQREALSALTQQARLRQGRLLDSTELKTFGRRAITAAATGSASIAGKEVQLTVGVDRRFAESLPIVFLRPWDTLGFIPHIDEDGYVCYADGEGLVLTTEDPVGILVATTDRAIRVLEDGVTGKNRWDFVDEFRAHWRRIATRGLQSFIEPSGVLREVIAYRGKDGYVFVADSDRELLRYFSGNGTPLQSLTRRNAVYVPLREGTFAIPPAPGTPWGTSHVQQLVREHVSPQNLRGLDKLTRKWKAEELVILGVPRRSGGMTLVGLRFAGVEGGHPLSGGTAKEPPEPLRAERRDADYLVPRGGGHGELSRLRVILVGCGSVGGYIAMAVPESGIADLTLVDPDGLEAENTFRHVLGHSALGRPKVHGLKDEIERKYPYVRVIPHHAYIQDAIADGLVSLTDFDLAIVAVGNPTVELEINRQLHLSRTRTMGVLPGSSPTASVDMPCSRAPERGAASGAFTPPSSMVMRPCTIARLLLLRGSSLARMTSDAGVCLRRLGPWTRGERQTSPSGWRSMGSPAESQGVPCSRGRVPPTSSRQPDSKYRSGTC